MLSISGSFNGRRATTENPMATDETTKMTDNDGDQRILRFCFSIARRGILLSISSAFPMIIVAEEDDSYYN